MKFVVVTLMPELVQSATSFGVVGQSIKAGAVTVEILNPRKFTEGAHHAVDDRVFGGGDGMLMQAEPLARSIDEIRDDVSSVDLRVIHLSPRGKPFNDSLAKEWATSSKLTVLIASRYAGVDQRFIDEYAVEEVSIGDFVVSGGEIPAALIIDAVARQIPGTLGNRESATRDSFAEGLLECSQFTRPREWRDRSVPFALLSGDPTLIGYWEFLDSVRTTCQQRPDLLSKSVGENVTRRLEEISRKIASEKKRNSIPEGRKLVVDDLEKLLAIVSGLFQTASRMGGRV